VVTGHGDLLDPAIVIPDNAASISIGRDGTVTAELVAGGGQVALGQINLARFINPAGLQPMGQNLYKETAASGAPVVLVPGTEGIGFLRQGMLEASNVNVVEEMVNMIETQRAYEVNSKSISATDGMLRFLNQNL
jgi:flagellar basal-body rod protein FlgG